MLFRTFQNCIFEEIMKDRGEFYFEIYSVLKYEVVYSGR